MYHTVIILGNLGRDPEMRYLPSGQPVTTMNIATNHKYTDSDGQLVKETTWFRVSVFGKQAESSNQYLKKGSSVLIQGRLRPDPSTGGPRVWNRQDGTPSASFEVTAQTVKFVGGRAAGEGSYQGGEFEETPSSAGEDDIPF
jgi:single-strand DNA-binding protein